MRNIATIPTPSANTYCRAYVWCSVSFYMLMLLFAPAAFLIPIGAHAPYYIFVLYQLMVLEWGILSPGIHVLLLIVLTELAFFLVFILANKKKDKGNVLPFLLFMLCSHAISMSPFALKTCMGASISPSPEIVCGLIGNTVYLMLCFWQFMREQKV